MPVSLSAKETQIFEEAKAFALEHLEPRSEEWERQEGHFPYDGIELLIKHGYYSMGIPKEMGGGGYSWLECALAYEGLAHGSNLVCLLLLLNNMVYGLSHYCQLSDEVKALLPGLVRGEKSIAFAITEEQAGSDVSAMTSHARLEKDGYHITGKKSWILNTKYADHLLVTVKEPAKDRMIMLLVDKGTPGMRVGDNVPRMGSNLMYCSHLYFDDCVVPESRLISEDAFRTALKFIDIPRVFVPPASIGLAQRAVDLTAAYLSRREAFKKPLLANQGIQWDLADFTTQLEAGRWLNYHTATLFDQKDQGASLSAAMSKLYGPELAMEVTTRCVQYCGAAGYARSSKVSRFMDAAKMLQIVDGTTEIQRLVIGRKLMKNAENDPFDGRI